MQKTGEGSPTDETVARTRAIYGRSPSSSARSVASAGPTPGSSRRGRGRAPRRPHPTQFQIIEAMHWIGQLISASQPLHVLDRDPKDLSAVSYHLRRLSELKIVRFVSVKRVRWGAKERLYKLGVISVGSRPAH